LKSGSLNLLEPSGTVQACKGNALPLQAYNNRERHVSNVRNESKKSAGCVSKISVITFSHERKDSGSNERLQSLRNFCFPKESEVRRIHLDEFYKKQG
jgi:hypothetical protein